jgi:hypothetical protein
MRKTHNVAIHAREENMTGSLDVLERTAKRRRTAETILQDLDLMNKWRRFGRPVLVGALSFDLAVAPEMHRVHHSVIAQETNSNFGFNMPWWDFLLGTYRAQPVEGHTGMTIGLYQFRDPVRADRLHWMLLLPLVGKTGDYPVNRRGPTSAR